MEARKKRVPAKKTTKRKPSSKSTLAVKQILEKEIELYQEKRTTPSIVQEDAVVYGKNKPKQASDQEIGKKLKALKDLIGIAPGLYGDAQDYVNRLRDNDRF